jgi:hypothetical protein
MSHTNPDRDNEPGSSKGERRKKRPKISEEDDIEELLEELLIIELTEEDEDFE